MNVLVTHSYFLHFDPKQLKLSKPYPPLATLLSVNILKSMGHQVFFYDVTFDTDLIAIKKMMVHTKPDLLLICDDGFNYLTKMCLTNMRQAAFEMLRHAKASGIKAYISSSDSTDHYAMYLDAGADAVIMGEPELTLKELISVPHDDYAHVHGIAFYDGENTVVTSRRPVMQQLDDLPFAAWDILNIVPYQQAWKKHGYFSINLSTTRGCPYKCNWCAKPIYGNRYNVRSPKHVVNELLYMATLFNYDHIWFCDDIFGLKPGWLEEFANTLINSNLKLHYKIQCRADLLQNEKIWQLLSASGADEVWIGAESGSQKILDAMDKGITIEQIATAVIGLKKHHVKPCLFLQFGYYGETLEDIRKTFDMLKHLQPHDIGVSVSYPLPGTKYYENIKALMSSKKNWSDSDELLLMYQSGLSARFYKALHRYVHKSFRARQSWNELLKLVKNSNGNWWKALHYFYYVPASFAMKIKMQLLKYE
jgi:radical SAM superfamily enzyme YgiQ (UPF0313 family)